MDANRPSELHDQASKRLTHPAWLVSLFLLSAVLRISAPNDLFEGDQNKQVGYIMDVLRHGHWSTQFEVNGYIATKPPLYNWIAAGFCRLAGSTDPWVLKLPSILAAAALLVCLYRLTQHFLGQTAAFFAALTFIACHHFSKLMWFARTDMLMTATLYAAILVFVAVKQSWWKSTLVGLILAASALTKGPVGPCLFGVFLLMWCWTEGIRPQRKTLMQALPGLLVFTVIVSTWLIAVSRIPDFHESVIQNELSRRLPGSTVKTKPFYYYVSHLLTRVAPWSAVGLLGAILAFRHRQQWKRVRLLVCWAAAYFLFFSAIPSKRHDLLLPVYPVVFMLAGYALEHSVRLFGRKDVRTSFTAAGALLILAGAYVLAVAEGSFSAGIAVATAVSGAVTIWLAQRRRAFAVHAVAVGCLFANGLYYHWANIGPRVDYREFASFMREVDSQTGGQGVLVYHAHPLVSYELGLHEEFPDPRDLLKRRPQWLIAPAPEVPIIKSWTRWELEPVAEFSFHGQREIDATLFRVEPAPLPTASRVATSAN